MVCDKRMALIVDDTIDVWQDDLANLFLIRRFVGDASDDGLQRLSWQLQHVHQAYFARVGKFSLDDAVYEPPDVREVLQSIRGSLLQGCHLALTGVVPDQSEDTLDQQPLCVLLKLYGAQLTLDITEATHLVARKKDGWTKSTKIRRALQRCQVPHSAHEGQQTLPGWRLLPVIVPSSRCDVPSMLSREIGLPYQNVVVSSICERNFFLQMFPWWVFEGGVAFPFVRSASSALVCLKIVPCAQYVSEVGAERVFFFVPLSSLVLCSSQLLLLRGTCSVYRCRALYRCRRYVCCGTKGCVRFSQEDAKLHAVWDHWLLDSIVTWELQPERVYAIPDPSVDEAADAPSSSLAAVNSAFVSEGLGGRLSEIIGGQGALGVLPTRKRTRDPALAEQQVPSKESVATKARMSVAQYLKQKETGVVGMAPRDCAGNANEVSMLDQDDSVSGED